MFQVMSRAVSNSRAAIGEPVELGRVLVPLHGVEFILAQVIVAVEGGDAADGRVVRHFHRFHLNAGATGCCKRKAVVILEREVHHATRGQTRPRH